MQRAWKRTLVAVGMTIALAPAILTAQPPVPPKDEAELERRLRTTRIDLDIDEKTTFADLFKIIDEKTGVLPVLGFGAFEAGINSETHVVQERLSFRRTPLVSVLDRVLEETGADMTFTIRGGIFTITTPEEARKFSFVRLYKVGDLLESEEECPAPPQTGSSQFPPPESAPPKTEATGFADASPPNRRKHLDRGRFEELMTLIESMVSLESWDEDESALEPVERGDAIAVRQPLRIHWEVEEFLAELRKQMKAKSTGGQVPASPEPEHAPAPPDVSAENVDPDKPVDDPAVAERRLRFTRLSFEPDERTTFGDLFAVIQKHTGLHTRLGWEARESGISAATAIVEEKTAFRKERLPAVLDALLEPHKLTFTLQGPVLLIDTLDAVKRRPHVRIYKLDTRLLVDGWPTWRFYAKGATCEPDPRDFQHLIDLIETVVAPDTWSDEGVDMMEFYPGNLLVVRNALRAHWEIEELLANLLALVPEEPVPFFSPDKDMDRYEKMLRLLEKAVEKMNDPEWKDQWLRMQRIKM